MSEMQLSKLGHDSEFMFEGNIRSILIEGEPHWSILDLYEHHGNSSNPNRDWSRDINELAEQGFDVLPKLVAHTFLDKLGRENKPTPVVNLDTLMRIVQVAKFKKWEPLRQKMASLMADTIRNIKRTNIHWQSVYEKEFVSHMQLMDALETAVWFVCQGWHYRKATSAVFEGMFGRSRDQISSQMGLRGTLAKPELNQSIPALSYLTIAKELARLRLDERSELDYWEAWEIIYDAAREIAPQVKAFSRLIGKDIATGIPLLPEPETDMLDDFDIPF